MYNAERYIAECLDSILAQTFKNFEVIVVNDCSTDSSAAIVESYVSKFGGRLTLTSLEKNSGNAGYTARNKGLTLAHGEFVYFVDADDFIAKTALDELYTAAKENAVEVVYIASRHFFTAEGGVDLKRDWFGNVLLKKGFTDESTLTLNDPHKNLQNLLVTGGWFWTSWSKFVRREFLIENNITFYEIFSLADYIWTIELFACAERFLRIPNAVYYWRDDAEESITRNKRTTDVQIALWSKNYLNVTKSIADLFNKNSVLKERPEYLYCALMRAFNFCFKINLEARLQITSQQIFDILRREFESFGDADPTIPYMFCRIDGQEKDLIKFKKRVKKIERFAKKYKARIVQLEDELKKLQT